MNRSVLLDEMRSCVKRGHALPEPPSPIELWEALGGTPEAGVSALIVMLDYFACQQQIEEEKRRGAGKGTNRPRASGKIIASRAA